MSQLMPMPPPWLGGDIKWYFPELTHHEHYPTKERQAANHKPRRNEKRPKLQKQKYVEFMFDIKPKVKTERLSVREPVFWASTLPKNQTGGRVILFTFYWVGFKTEPHATWCLSGLRIRKRQWTKWTQARWINVSGWAVLREWWIYARQAVATK